MMNYGLFLGWNRAVPGREMDSIELFGSFTKYVDGLKEKGMIDSHEPGMLDVHGGDLNGFWLIRGERAKLDEVMETEEWNMWISKAMYTMDGFGVIRTSLGEKIGTRMSTFQKVIK
mgnify:CR=1 FL=1